MPFRYDIIDPTYETVAVLFCTLLSECNEGGLVKMNFSSLFISLNDLLYGTVLTGSSSSSSCSACSSFSSIFLLFLPLAALLVVLALLPLPQHCLQYFLVYYFALLIFIFKVCQNNPFIFGAASSKLTCVIYNNGFPTVELLFYSSHSSLPLPYVAK